MKDSTVAAAAATAAAAAAAAAVLHVDEVGSGYTWDVLTIYRYQANVGMHRKTMLCIKNSSTIYQLESDSKDVNFDW